MVKCRIGEEKETLLLLMRKFLTYQNTDEPLLIKSVVVPEGVKGKLASVYKYLAYVNNFFFLGYVYIESYKQTHTKAAITNVGNLRMGIWKQEMVPIKEMTDVLKVVKEQSGLKPKQWVRLKRGKKKSIADHWLFNCKKYHFSFLGLYKDDIAQVDYVDLAQNQVHLKLLPRIDYTRLRGALRTTQTVSNILKKVKVSLPGGLKKPISLIDQNQSH
jgi:transcription elongation factor SPT5